MNIFLLRVMASTMVCCLLVFQGCDRATSDSIPGSNTAKPLVERAAAVTVTIEFNGIANDIEYESKWQNGTTVLDVLHAAAEENQFPVDASGRGGTAFVKAINGIVGGQGGNAHWIYSVNGQIAQQGSGVYLLQPGDSVLWRMGKYP